MIHALDGARLKVVRAQEHLDSLKAEIRMHLDEHPDHVFRSQPDRNLQSLSIPQTYTVNTPPMRLSAIIGDCVTNARASIDYIVWELSQKCFIPAFDVTDFKDRQLVSFPIDGTFNGTGFSDRLHRLTKRGLPAAAIGQIKAAQTNGRQDDVLAWLHKLVNTDKHRMPLLTLTELDAVSVTLATPPLYADIIKTPAVLKIPKDRAITPPGIGFTLHSDVAMKGEATFCVSLEDVTMPRVPVETTLEQIIKTVADIIPRFDPFFS